MIPLEEARATVLAGCRPLPPRPRPWHQLELGQVLATDVVAPGPVPPFANTAMDGYAVRASDVVAVPVRLPVVGEIGAGHPPVRALGAGQAMRIFTGAPIPDGADAIVIVEHTERVAASGGAGPAPGSHGEHAAGPAGLGMVEIREVAVAGAHIRPPGDDIQAGEVVVRAGDALTPGRLGIVRTVGVEQLLVHPRPRVGVLSTGDELVQEGKLGPGQIYDSNRPTLLALVAGAGGEPVDLGHAGDDDAAITATLSRGIETCDLVLSTGGVSMGDTDLVKVVLERMAGVSGPGRMRWMQVAIRPAKPLAFGVVGAAPAAGHATGSAAVAERAEVPVVGLPGNPVSSMVSFELFARPALRRLAGHPDDRLVRPTMAGRAGEALPRRSDGKVHFVRVVAQSVDGELVVRSAGGQGSHQLSAMARANALAVVPDGIGVDPGDRVDLLVFGDL